MQAIQVTVRSEELSGNLNLNAWNLYVSRSECASRPVTSFSDCDFSISLLFYVVIFGPSPCIAGWHLEVDHDGVLLDPY
jgi:hypothetical protein